MVLQGRAGFHTGGCEDETLAIVYLPSLTRSLWIYGKNVRIYAISGANSASSGQHLPTVMSPRFQTGCCSLSSNSEPKSLTRAAQSRTRTDPYLTHPLLRAIDTRVQQEPCMPSSTRFQKILLCYGRLLSLAALFAGFLLEVRRAWRAKPRDRALPVLHMREMRCAELLLRACDDWRTRCIVS